MPRKPRLHSPGGLYHVILRGNNRQDILNGDADRFELEKFDTPRLDCYRHSITADICRRIKKECNYPDRGG